MALAVAAAPAAGQSATDDLPRLAALTADEFIRAGADVRYYPFGRLRAGDVVKVIGEKSGWAQVATVGPAFRECFGFIKYPRAANTTFQVAADGRSGTAVGATDLFAPNLDAGFDPGSSWKPMITVPEGETLKIIETARRDGEIVHRVVLPEIASGWVELAKLRPATPSETAAWEAAIRQPEPRTTGAEAKPPAEPVEKTADDDVVPVAQDPLGRAKLNEGAAVEPAPQRDAAPDEPPADGTAPPAPGAPKPAVKIPPQTRQARLARVMLEDLEAAYARLLAEPIETAEVEPLRLLYLDLAKRHPDSRRIARYATSRAKQLDLWAEVQEQRLALKELIVQAEETSQTADVTRQVFDSIGDYVAVGRLEASTIYDGRRLPKLYRLFDTSTSRTLGYVEPREKLQFAELLGHRVGVVGEKAYDGGLQVNLIHPRRIDVLDAGE